jgi:hypothetical protein
MVGLRSVISKFTHPGGHFPSKIAARNFTAHIPPIAPELEGMKLILKRQKYPPASYPSIFSLPSVRPSVLSTLTSVSALNYIYRSQDPCENGASSSCSTSFLPP